MKTKCLGTTFPFVHHTALGWSLVGPVSQFDERSPETLILRTSCQVNSPQVTPLSDTHKQLTSCHMEHVSEVEPHLSNDVFARELGDEELDVSADDRALLRLLSNVAINLHHYELPQLVHPQTSA